MSKSSQFCEEELLFSCIFGSGIYRNTGITVQDPIGDNCGGGCSPLFRNVISGESYYMKLLDCPYEMWNKTREHVLNPPNRKHILWPVDMVNLRDKQIQCNLFATQEYTDAPLASELRSANMGLLFPYGDFPNMVSGTIRIHQIGSLSWKNKAVQRIAYNIMEAMDSINRSGYVYEDIHLSRFFFMQNDVVFLNYTNLTFSMKEIFSKDADTLCAYSSNEYPIEFADPAVYSGMKKSLDFQSQNYSLTALMFYLFTGQYPYDGRLLTGYLDESPQQHYIKFRDYIKMPVFIFDPQDTENALGSFAEEEIVISLWKEMPSVLKQLFTSTLCRSNAERTSFSDNPTPSMWLQVFQILGWTNTMEES